jgi:hypothetical protein
MKSAAGTRFVMTSKGSVCEHKVYLSLGSSLLGRDPQYEIKYSLALSSAGAALKNVVFLVFRIP